MRAKKQGNKKTMRKEKNKGDVDVGSEPSTVSPSKKTATTYESSSLANHVGNAGSAASAPSPSSY